MGDRNIEKGKSENKVDHLYRVNRKGYKKTVEELKQCIKAKDATRKRYKNRVKQYQKTDCSNLTSQRSVRNWMESHMKRI